jgi:tetratricopeptide (TPR) repeat protein
MKKPILVKTFIHALEQFYKNPVHFKRCLEDKRLTQEEKKILFAWLLVRDKKCTEAIDLLTKVDGQFDSLVLSQKNLILGICFNNKSEYDHSLKYFEACLPELIHYELHHFLFTAYYNMFISSWNLKKLPSMIQFFDKMNTIEDLNVSEQLRLKSCELILAIFQDHHSKAETLMEELNPHYEKMDESLKANYSIIKFTFFLKLKLFDRCQLVLKEMKDTRKFQPSANFNFMSVLLQHMISDKPIYFTESLFKDHFFLFWQMKTIQSFEKSLITEAEKAWEHLHSKNPTLYAPHFEFKGDECLFSIALDKHRWKISQPEVTTLPASMKKEDAFMALLTQAKRPLTKEEVYQAVWQRELLDKEDFGKLKKLASRLLKKGLPIVYHRGCYHLEKKSKKTA